ncbi:type I restriction enzyme HsdR N-terminal domain-containing protein [Argonema galeatum]|uniref:type I restriction enzyme HsdR N-terminal domain-containing protein n=1 Tax=Argonema galeatum TaxID=2942762 RepID=UPI0020116B98|nr:type I restriction enzyme HsdR N-terminal domain-containing protein [Argonema galeatum]MCL1465584.1 type I restriction enzyme HsdR N-terminal domain-containing protein [Argonema galeatum A003/A1]
MVQTFQATEITLYDLKARFGLEIVEDEQFFREWLDNLPEITDMEKQRLDRVKASYLNLAEYPMLEEAVKMVVVSPLLDLAGFYLPPFRLITENQVQIALEDENIVVKGKIDVLVVKDRFWVLVIESKRSGISLEAGLAQALAYMLGSPNHEKPILGMVTNGIDFQFIKLVKENTPKYALSDSFNLRDRGNELYGVLSIMKRIAEILEPSS